MRQAIIPFLIYSLLQIFVFFVGMNVVSKIDKPGIAEFFRIYIYGHMIVLACIQIISVPMILLRVSFLYLYAILITIFSILIVFGVKRFIILKYYKLPSLNKYFKGLSPLCIILVILLICVIFMQFGIYFMGVHLDEDDARWLAEANDALEYGDMMTRNFSTGEYNGAFVVPKDVTSPWPMYWAFFSKLLHVRASVFSHSLYAPIALLIMYVVYYLIARELFEKRESHFIFLLSVALINMFFCTSIYTQSVFSMTRIWQGKATVAAIIIPLMIYIFVCIHKRNETMDWMRLTIVSCGACLLSGMGISLSLILIGIYGFYDIIVYKRWNRFPALLCAILPSILFSGVYFLIKGL